MFNHAKMSEVQLTLADVLNKPIPILTTLGAPVWAGHAVGHWRMGDEWERYLDESKRNWGIYTLLIGYGIAVIVYSLVNFSCGIFPFFLQYINQIVNGIVIFIGLFAWIRLSNKAETENRTRKRRIRKLLSFGLKRE